MTTPLSRGRQIAANKKTVIAEMEASPMYDHLPIIRGMPNADARSVANSFARYPSDYADALACKNVVTVHKTDADNLKSVLKANSKWHLLIPAWFGQPHPKCPLLTDKSPFRDVELFIDAQEKDHPGTRTYFVLTDDDTTAMLIKLSM